MALGRLVFGNEEPFSEFSGFSALQGDFPGAGGNPGEFSVGLVFANLASLASSTNVTSREAGVRY